MNWIGHPGLPKGTLSLVGLNDGFDYIFLSTGFQRFLQKLVVKPVIGSSTDGSHGILSFFAAKGLVFLDGVGSIMINFPGGSSRIFGADVPLLVAWGVWVHHLEILGEKGMQKIRFKSDSNRKYSAVSTNHHC